MGEGTVSGLMFADDFVGISETNTRRVTRTDGEGTKVHKEGESDSECTKVRSSSSINSSSISGSSSSSSSSSSSNSS